MGRTDRINRASGIRRRRLLRLLAATVVVAAIAAACAGASTPDETVAATSPDAVAAGPTETPVPTTAATSEPIATRPPEPTATAAPKPTTAPTPQPTATPEPPALVYDDASLAAAAGAIDVDSGTFLYAIVDADGAATIGTNGTDPDGVEPGLDSVILVGSVTKTFTAVATLTLVDDGLVDLDAPAADYVTRVPVSDDVTVRHLLQHTSSIPSYTDNAAFLEEAFGPSSRRWTPEEIHSFVDDRVGIPPGVSFSYSNTNYVILGLLIEEVTGLTYDQAVRQRIIDPLGLDSTHLLGFEEGPSLFDPPRADVDADLDLSSIATGAWAAGAMASTATDLHVFFRGLFTGDLLSDDLLGEIASGAELVRGTSTYGFGLDLRWDRHGLVGHNGGIPGYLTVALHAPATGETVVLVSTDARHFDLDDQGFTARRSLEMRDLIADLVGAT